MGNGFYPAYRKGGGAIEATPYYIASNVAVRKGQVVEYGRTGVVVLSGDHDTDADDPVLGVAAVDHDGTTAGYDTGNEILVWDDPMIVFKHVPSTESTTTGGDATSWIDNSLTAADDVFNGGHIVITDTNDVPGFNVGDVLTITDFANSGGDCTVSGAGGDIAAGMKGYIYPGYAAVCTHGFDFTSDSSALDLDSAGGECFLIERVDWDPQLKKATIFGRFRLHQLGNDAAPK
jgi:hypothetical protein